MSVAGIEVRVEVAVEHHSGARVEAAVVPHKGTVVSRRAVVSAMVDRAVAQPFEVAACYREDDQEEEHSTTHHA